MNTITFRSASPEDAGKLRGIYAPYVDNTAISFEYTPPSLEEFAQRIQNTLSRYPYIVAEKDGKILGYAYAGSFKARAAYDHCVEVSLYVDASNKGQGIGRALYRELEKRLEDMGIKNLYACIAFPPVEDEYLTKDSVRFHEAMGYKTVGHFNKCGYKFKRWYDMVWLEKFIGEHK